MVHSVFLPSDSNRGPLLLASIAMLLASTANRAWTTSVDQKKKTSTMKISSLAPTACRATSLCQVVLPDNTPTVAHSPCSMRYAFSAISRLTVITHRSVRVFSRPQLSRGTRHELPITRDNTNIKCLRASQHPRLSYLPKKGHCPSSPASIIGSSLAVKAAGIMSYAVKSAFIIMCVWEGIPISNDTWQ